MPEDMGIAVEIGPAVDCVAGAKVIAAMPTLRVRSVKAKGA